MPNYPNPYDFVSLEQNAEPSRYKWNEAESGLAYWRPDRYSGSLACVLRPETPLFVHGAQQQGQEQRRFMRLNGRPGIPGSSLKGAIRSIYEIVSDSCLSSITDKYQAPRSHIRTYRNLSQQEYDARHPLYLAEKRVPAPYLPCKTIDCACSACLLFGMVEQQARQEGEAEGTPLAGRLILSDAQPRRTQYQKLPIPGAGGGPHPWHSPFYFQDEGRGPILGRKLYFHHKNYRDTLNLYGDGGRSGLVELEVHLSEFAFSIAFLNLSRTELEFLIYALVLEPTLRHHIGYGKAYGLGSAAILVEQINFSHKAEEVVPNRFLTWQPPVIAAESPETWANAGKKRWLDRPNAQAAYAQFSQILAWPGKELYKYPDFRWFRDTPGSGNVTLAEYQQGTRVKADPAPRAGIAARSTADRLRGTVKKFDAQRGFGFIQVANSRRDLFVHINNVQGRRELHSGQEVEFEEGPGRKPGETEAKNVTPL